MADSLLCTCHFLFSSPGQASEGCRQIGQYMQQHAQQEAMLQSCIAQYQSAQGLVDGIEDEERRCAGRHAAVAEVVGQMGTTEGNGKQVEVPAEADSPQPLPATEPNASGQSYAASHSPRQVFCFVHLCAQSHAEQEVGYNSGPDRQYPSFAAQRKAECQFFGHWQKEGYAPQWDAVVRID